MSDTADFFVAGGTLRSQAPSYVTRPADQELFECILEGQFCYALTSRQMGKSSLMVRTTRRLKQAGVATAMIDLTGIGVTDIDPWYIGMLTKIKADLRLSINVESWWTARQTLSAPQCFIEFLHDVVLVERREPIAIFVDEIDSTLALPFRDDFFAAIRAMYNARANDPVYNRLTFALLGVATPTDLIQDRTRTPFNIGRRIVLQELSGTDAAPLQQGLEAIYPGQGHTLLARIFYWTNGHPYLTQKVCLAAVQADRTEWSNQDIDELVEANFLIKEARKESNLQFIQDRIRSNPPNERRRMLKLYQRIYNAKTVYDDDRSPTQNRLELAGLVGVGKGKLRIRNRIYQHVFDKQWIKDNTPANTQIRTVIVAGITTLLLAAFIIYRTLNPVTQTTVQADICISNFEKNTALAVRLEALACLFDRPGYQETAWRLFYNDMSSYDQKRLFLSPILEISTNPQIDQQIITVVKGVYTTLDSSTSNYSELTDAMMNALNISQQTESYDLKMQISNWKDGHKYSREGDFPKAINMYTLTIESNPRNISAYYDRADTFIRSGRNDEALKDLNRIINITISDLPTPTPAPTFVLTPTYILITEDVSPISPTLETAISTSLSTTPVPTIIATFDLISTHQTSDSVSRFINSDMIIQTVIKTIQDNSNLLNFFTQHQDEYIDLKDLVIRGRISLPDTEATAHCIVDTGGVTIHILPNDDSNIDALPVGFQFMPIAKNIDNNNFVWVKVPATAANPEGWVYAGISPQLVTCTGLENLAIVASFTPSTSTSLVQIASVTPQTAFVGSLPLVLTLQGTALDQVRAARLVAQDRAPIDTVLQAAEASQLTLSAAALPEPVNGAVSYRLELDGVVLESPVITLRDFIERKTVQGIQPQYEHTGRIASDDAGTFTRLRAEANAESEPGAQLRNGDEVEILAIDTIDWYELRIRSSADAAQIGATGWIERWLVDNQGVPPTPAVQVFAGRVYSAPTDVAVQCGTVFDSSIYGSVEGANGRGISGARLRITSADGKNVYNIQTGRGGVYSVPGLGCTTWTVRLIGVPNAPGGLQANAVTVRNLNGGRLTAAEVRFRQQP
jgi:tetratricopeptide (TPR) repeat protein